MIGRVLLPDALERKYPSAAAEWGWHWVFPQKQRWVDRRTAQQGRHHVDASIVQRAVRRAAMVAGLAKRVSCHSSGTRSPRTSSKTDTRHPDRSGVAGAQGREDHHDLHACAQSRTVGGSEPDRPLQPVSRYTGPVWAFLPSAERTRLCGSGSSTHPCNGDNARYTGFGVGEDPTRIRILIVRQPRYPHCKWTATLC